jgi:hypothetical protein
VRGGIVDLHGHFYILRCLSINFEPAVKRAPLPAALVDSRGAVDHTYRAIRLRDRAEDCRALARIIPAEAGAATYLRYAEDYDALAEQEERLARDAAELEINNQQN